MSLKPYEVDLNCFEVFISCFMTQFNEKTNKKQKLTVIL